MKKPNNLLHFIRCTNIKGEVIEKRFTANKPYQDIINFWRDVDKLSIRIRERMTKKAEYMEGTKKRFL